MEGVLTLRDISSALALFYVLLQGTFSIALLIAHLSPVSYRALNALHHGATNKLISKIAPATHDHWRCRLSVNQNWEGKYKACS